MTAEEPPGVTPPFSIDDVPWEEAFHGERFGIRFRSLCDRGGGSRVGVSYEELPPGRQAYPKHYHMLAEEHLLVLEGELTLLFGDETFALGPRDFVTFPAGARVGHAFQNRTEEPVRYLIIGERNPHDVIVYTDSGRVSVAALGEAFRRSETMDYWEGEED